MRFEWNEDKNQRNIEKHGIDFRTARRIWKQGGPVEIARRIVSGEERITVRGNLEGQYIVVVYTKRRRRIRLISARRANRKERPHG